jgi:hypothetical protein
VVVAQRESLHSLISFANWRVDLISGYFQTSNVGAPGPSHSGTGDATDLNPESVRDALGQSPLTSIAHGTEPDVG